MSDGGGRSSSNASQGLSSSLNNNKSWINSSRRQQQQQQHLQVSRNGRVLLDDVDDEFVRTMNCRGSNVMGLRFNPDPWNVPSTQRYNNCYAYAFNDLRRDRSSKPQPGERTNGSVIPSEKFSCNNLKDAIASDYPSTMFLQQQQPCPCGYWKAFMALDETPGNKDYHFWRQDFNGYWSHKPGDLAATNRDGDGRLITNPLTANRIVGEFHYKTPCGFLCIKHQQ